MPELSPSPQPAQAPQQSSTSSGGRWLTLAVGSGAFAAFNGVFAKLTTTAQTHNIASSISAFLGLSADNVLVEYGLRAAFFGLNLLSNAIMWFLFTRALTAATSTTRVSILNTAANFMVTAILSFVIFSEGLPLGWWAGAACLVAGSVIIGAREGKAQKEETKVPGDADGVAGAGAIGLASGGVSESVRLQEQYADEFQLEDEVDSPLPKANATTKDLSDEESD